MTEIKFRKPNTEDGKDMWLLVKNNKPLDENSLYLYVLLCHHFSDTCVVAESDSKIVGFVSAFIPPKHPQTLFVWQIAVDSEFRNQGIAQSLVSKAIEQTGEEIKFVEATVTASNKASLKFLKNFAIRSNADFDLSPLFSTNNLGNDHEPEDLVRIGPIPKKIQEITL